MIGPGKYDTLCTFVRLEAQAECALILILNGSKGSGFSMQNRGPSIDLPLLLETMAAEIREDMGGGNADPKAD